MVELILRYEGLIEEAIEHHHARREEASSLYSRRWEESERWERHIRKVFREFLIIDWTTVFAFNKDGTVVCRVERVLANSRDGQYAPMYSFLEEHFPQLKLVTQINKKQRYILQGTKAKEFMEFRGNYNRYLIEQTDAHITSSIITDIELYFKWVNLPRLPRGRGKRTPEMVEEVNKAREEFKVLIES